MSLKGSKRLTEGRIIHVEMDMHPVLVAAVHVRLCAHVCSRVCLPVLVQKRAHVCERREHLRMHVQTRHNQASDRAGEMSRPRLSCMPVRMR